MSCVLYNFIHKSHANVDFMTILLYLFFFTYLYLSIPYIWTFRVTVLKRLSADDTVAVHIKGEPNTQSTRTSVKISLICTHKYIVYLYVSNIKAIVKTLYKNNMLIYGWHHAQVGQPTFWQFWKKIAQQQGVLDKTNKYKLTQKGNNISDQMV